MHVARNHHHIIGRLVVDNKRIVTVVDHTARGVYRLAEECIVVGVIFIFVILDLQPEQTAHVDYSDDYDEAADYVFPFLKLIIFAHCRG